MHEWIIDICTDLFVLSFEINVQKGLSCAETIIGQGNTTAWKLCGLDRSTTLAVFFEIVPNVQSGTAAQPISQLFFIQFLTQYDTQPVDLLH